MSTYETICVHRQTDGHFYDDPTEREQRPWCVGPVREPPGLNDLQVVQDWRGFRGTPRPATTADLVAALIAEGGEIVTRCTTHGFQYCHNSAIDLRECNEVEVLVFGPIPVEEETTT